MSRKPALIFDFGNVIAHFDFTRSCAHFGRPIQLSGAEFLARARAAGFMELLEVYEAGKMTSQAFHAELCARMGIDVGYEEFAAVWGDIFSANETVHELVKVLKAAGYELYLGSNTNDMHFRHYRKQFDDVLSLFDALVLSYEVGYIKPDAGFFEAAARIANRPAGECIFIDDVEVNIDGARSAGLVALHYRDTPTLLRELAELGISA